MWNVIMRALPYTLVWIMYLADLHWMQITDATGNYDNDRTSQKKIYFKQGLMRNAKNVSYANDIQKQW